MKQILKWIPAVYLALSLTSCLSFSHTTDILPSNSPRILENGQFGAGVAGGVAAGFLTIAGSGVSGTLNEVAQQDTVFFRWGVSPDPKYKTEVGFNLNFNFSKAYTSNSTTMLPYTYLGGNASFAVRRQMFATKALSGSWGLQAGAGPLFNYELMANGSSYGIFYGAVKISLQNQFTFLTQNPHHNFYWTFGPNITVDILSMSVTNYPSQYFPVIEVDAPLKLGYVMSFTPVDFFMEAGFHPGLFAGMGNYVFMFVAPSFNIGIQFNTGSGMRKE
jgi:hypothetical protein